MTQPAKKFPKTRLMVPFLKQFLETIQCLRRLIHRDYDVDGNLVLTRARLIEKKWNCDGVFAETRLAIALCLVQRYTEALLDAAEKEGNNYTGAADD